MSAKEYAELMNAVGQYQNGDVYGKTKNGELIVPLNGNLYYIGGTYQKPIVNTVIEIDIAEDRDIEDTKHHAIQEVITGYAEGKLPLLQGRSLEDVCRLIDNVATDSFGTRVSTRIYSSNDSKRFSKLRPTRSNREWSEAGKTLRKSIEERVRRDRLGNGVEGDSEGKVKYSFRGVSNLSTKEKKVFSIAEDLDRMGADSEQIRFATGWFKGYDGKWRYEIDDSGAKLLITDIREKRVSKVQQKIDKIKEDFKNGKFGSTAYHRRLFEAEIDMRNAKDVYNYTRETFKLSDILSHPRLYKLYPQLKDINVRFDISQRNDGLLGYRNDDSNTIGLKQNFLYGGDDAIDTLMHEIQHAIQTIEGFARGSNLTESELDKEDLINAKRREISSRIGDVESDIRTKVERTIETKYPDMVDYTSLLGTGCDGYAGHLHDYLEQKIVRVPYNMRYGKENAEYFLEKAKKYKEYESDKALFEEIDKASEVLSAANKEILDYANLINSESAFDRYQRTAGEIEARDTSNRRKLSEEERLAKRPDIDRTDAIVKYSRRVTSLADLEKANTDLRDQYNELKADAEHARERWAYWKGQTKLSNGASAVDADIQRTAKSLLKEYSSTVELNEAKSDLRKIAKMFLEKADAGKVKSAAVGLARKIVNGSQELISPDEDAYPCQRPECKPG